MYIVGKRQKGYSEECCIGDAAIIYHRKRQQTLEATMIL